MNESVKSIYYDYLLGRIAFEEAIVDINSIFAFEYLKGEFDILFDNHDESATEIIGILTILPSWFNLESQFLTYYNRLLTEPWHHAHEWLIDTIKAQKSPESIFYIEKAINANYEYLHSNDTNYASFIRRCMWALADINTEESRKLLENYLESDNPIIRRYADEQIRWLNGDKNTRFMDY